MSDRTRSLRAVLRNAAFVAAIVSLGSIALAQQRPAVDVMVRWGVVGVWQVDCRSNVSRLPDGQPNWQIVYEPNPDGSDTVLSTTRLDGKVMFQSVVSHPVLQPNGHLVSRYSNRTSGAAFSVTTEKSSGGDLKRSFASHPVDNPSAPLIRDGKFVSDGRVTQWFERCSAVATH